MIGNTRLVHLLTMKKPHENSHEILNEIPGKLF